MKRQNNYIDIHSHILPGVDDGPGSMEQTIRMLQMAVNERITTIIATPHYITGQDNPSAEELEELVRRVQQEAYRINENFQILPGSEIYCPDAYYSDAVIEALKSGNALTLAGSRYVLVEFSYNATFKSICLGINNLIYHGYMPILAHVERYCNLHRDTYKIEELVKMGCYIQMNCRSVIGSFPNIDAYYNRKLIKNGMVHFIASDCHSDGHRAPVMQSIVSYLTKKCDNDLLQEIFSENPTKIIKNTYI